MTDYIDKDGKPVRLKKDGTPDRRNPPEEYRFKPKVSGNPSGRPKGKVSVQNAVLKALSKTMQVHLGGEDVQLQTLDAMTLVMVRKSMKGDARAFAELIKHLPDDRPPGVADTPEKEAARQKMITEISDMIDQHQALRHAGLMRHEGDRTYIARWIYEEYIRREQEGIGQGAIDVDALQFGAALNKGVH